MSSGKEPYDHMDEAKETLSPRGDIIIADDRGHVGSYLGCERSLERHRRGDYVMGQDGWSTT